MRKILTLSLALLLSNWLIGQNAVFTKENKALNKIADINKTRGWVSFRNSSEIPAENVFTNYKEAFGLGNADAMILTKQSSDKLGFTHIRYNQTYNGIPVLGADYAIHAKNGIAVSGNGQIVNGLSLSVVPSITGEQAVQAALDLVKAELYMWQDPASEAFIKQVKNDPSATFYPTAELVIFDPTFSDDQGNYLLAFKVYVYAEKPLSIQNIYINAQTGALIKSINDIITTDVPGSAVTAYSGTQTITTDSTGPGAYRLREAGRCGIATYDMNEGTNYSLAVDFTDTDNVWNNVNADQDEVATDAHFGTEMTFDYFYNVHGRNSFDDAGADMISYVHYDVAYANAFWDGFRMTYGDGDGSNYGPFTALDVCGHEVTHAVSGSTAGFIYQDEPGALSEGYSDIFGACVEFYALDTAGDWLVGEDFDLVGNGLRNMQNPNEDQNPDTYLGQYWYIGSFDNGGVHTNSGVAGYWFYLLTEGGSGTNDLSHIFNVSGLGLDTAGAIAYRAMAVYLTSSSGYFDMREATLQAAIDLYGICSNPYVQTANAWFAVGVGQAIMDYDFTMHKMISPTTDCGLTSVSVETSLMYNGCNADINPGDTLFMFYSLDGGFAVADTFVVASTIIGGDSVSFTFSTPADVSVLGMHNIECWFVYMNDTVNYNDTLSGYQFENKLYQNSDVGVVKISQPYTECHLTSAEPISIEVGFFGCEFLPSGEDILVGYTINGGSPVYDTLTTTADFYPDTTFSFTFSTPADFSVPGTYIIDAFTAFAIDSLISNDVFVNFKVKNPLPINDTIVTFEQANCEDMYIVKLAPYAHAFTSTAANNTGAKGFQMTGGNAFDYYTMLEFPNGVNTWTINEFLSAKITYCVDATAWTNVNMKFDLKQTFGEDAYTTFLGPGDYTVASNFRILVNDITQIGGTYNPTTANSDPYNTHYINLDAYAGTQFTVTFETRNIAKDTMIIFIMDNAYIDNVRFRELDFSNVEQAVDLEMYTAVYPNPTSSMVNIDFFSNSNQEVNLAVFDLAGKLIISENKSAASGINRYTIDLQTFATGVYFLRLVTPEGIYNEKIIKN